MPSVVIKAQASGEAETMAGGQVAVVAVGAPREKLVEILAKEGHGFLAFDDIEALLKQSKSRPGLIVLWVEDASSGLTRCVEPLTRAFLETPLIVACRSIERWGIRAALTAGAAGIVLWKDLATTLGPCAQAVQAGQACVPRTQWRQLEPPALSSREKQILGLVVMGYTNGLIAQQLFLAESTVKSHLSSAFRKLGVRSRNEAVNLILDPERGLGMGILALGGEPVAPTLAAV